MGFRQFSLPNPTPGGSPYVDHLATLVDSLITLHATSTVTDNDGDTATANAAVQIGANLVFHDDGPSVSATLNANAQVVLDETATSSSISAITLVEIVKGDDPDVSGSGTISSGNSGSAVLNAAALFGADGPASSGSLSYALSIQNATSGLKVTDGSAINLALNNGAIVGVVAGGAFAGQAAFAISINASGVVTVEQYLSLQHPDATNPDDTVFLSAGHIGVAATATDFDGDKTSTSVVDLSGQIVFHDDAGTLGAFSNATLINGPNVHGLGTFSYVPGADGHGSFMITGPALPGVTYTTVQNATGALLTATADSDGAGPNPPVTVFTLQVNTDGTYDFTLVAPQTATTETVSLLGLSAGGPSPFVQTADGHVEFSGSGSGINSSTQGFGVSNQFVANGESFTIEFHNPGQAGDQAANVNPDLVSAITLNNNSINGSLTIQVTYYNDVAGTSEVQTYNVAGSSTVLNPVMAQFNRVSIVGVGGSGQGVRFSSLDISKTILPSDLNLSFQVKALDGDGDPTTVSTLAVHVSATPVVLDTNHDGHIGYLGLDAGVLYDMNHDGTLDHTAWAAPGDSILFRDADHNGTVSNATEFVFGHDGVTDMGALHAQYGAQLDASDADFTQFGLWNDANSNGLVDAGEVQSLADAGIISIGLVSDGVATVHAGGDVSVAGSSSFTYVNDNGTVAQGKADDAAFTYRDASVELEQRIAGASSNLGVVAAAVAAMGLAAQHGAARDADRTSHSQDQVKADDQGAHATHAVVSAPAAEGSDHSLIQSESRVAVNDEAPAHSSQTFVAPAESLDEAAPQVSQPMVLAANDDADPANDDASSMVKVAPAVVMAEAAISIGGGARGGVDHDAVQKVVALAIDHGGDMDKLLAHLPAHVAQALASHGGDTVPASDCGRFGGFTPGAVPTIAVEAMTLHHDAAPAA